MVSSGTVELWCDEPMRRPSSLIATNFFGSAMFNTLAALVVSYLLSWPCCSPSWLICSRHSATVLMWLQRRSPVCCNAQSTEARSMAQPSRVRSRMRVASLSVSRVNLTHHLFELGHTGFASRLQSCEQLLSALVQWQCEQMPCFAFFAPCGTVAANFSATDKRDRLFF